MKPRISIYNDWDHRHYAFTRNSRIPRGSFDTDWETLGHRLVPYALVVAILVALIVMGAVK